MAFRWGILGAGNIAGKFADAVCRTEDGITVAIASRDQKRAEDFAARHGIPAAYGSYEAMLAAEKPDAVYIATRTDSHAALTRLCIARGIPVLCEKAMFTSAAGALETLNFAREKGVFCMEAMWSRLLPAVQEMKRRLDAGEIGDPLYAELAIGWQAPSHPGNRFFDPAQGGGAAYDLTVYGYELADYFFGPPDDVTPVQVIWGESGVDETETVTLRWSSRPVPMLAVLSASIVTNLDERAVIHGTKGVLRMPKPHMAEGFTLTRFDGTEDAWQDEETVNGFVYEAEEVMRCVRAGLTESPAVPHDLTIRCGAIFDAINGTKE